MSDLITLEELEDAIGHPPDDADEQADWELYISVLSDFINNYVTSSFERVTETHRFKADWYGVVKLVKPVIQVTSVKDFATQEDCWYAGWEGLDEIFYLYPQQVVDVTYTYGYSAVPDDIKNLVFTGVKRAIGETSSIDLRSFQVGDVREEYRANVAAELLGSLGTYTLDKYADGGAFTINVGGSHRYESFSGETQFPTALVDAPTLTDVTPTSGDEDEIIAITFAGEDWVPGSLLQMDGVTVAALLDEEAGTGAAYLLSDTAGTVELTVLNPDGQSSDAVEFTFEVP